MKVTELATELTLKTLLIELAQDGVRYAQLEKQYADENYRNLSGQAYIQLGAISNVLASILPGVCPAQAQRGFIDFAATGIDPYAGMDMEDVEKLLAAIDVAWKKDEKMSSIEQARKLETKEGLIAELKERIRIRNQMCGVLYWNVVNDECMEIVKKCLSLGADRREIGKILNGE